MFRGTKFLKLLLCFFIYTVVGSLLSCWGNFLAYLGETVVMSIVFLCCLKELTTLEFWGSLGKKL